MPFTPFHFGPALLLKGLAPRHVSFTAFVASQVAIDLESLYYLLQRAWPVHRVLHTVLVAAPVGVLAGLLVWAVVALLPAVREACWPWSQGEAELGPAVVGGFLGGLSHPLLDGIMHADIQPFSPFSLENPLLGALDLEMLHLGCLALGAIGLPLAWLRLRRSVSA